MADMFNNHVTKSEMVAELEREIAMRRVVYAKQVTARKMNANIADRKIAVMTAVLELVKAAPCP